MKRLFVLGLCIFANVSQASEMSVAERSALVFDEDFGYADKVFLSGYHKGKRFKDIKAARLNPQVVGPQQTSSMAAINVSMFEALYYIYSYKVNPASVEAQFYRRLHSIQVSKEILKECDIEISDELSEKEVYYILTGKKLTEELTEELLESLGSFQEPLNVLAWCSPMQFMESLEAINQNRGSQEVDIFKVIDFQRDILDFQNAKIDFVSWKNSIPQAYRQVLPNDAALRCYYIYLYNHSILTSPEVKNKLAEFEFGYRDTPEELAEILCPYPTRHAYCEAGYEEPEDDLVYKKLFGELKVNKYIADYRNQ